MRILGRNRDSPKREKRNAPSREMQDFIRGIDVDFGGKAIAA